MVKFALKIRKIQRKTRQFLNFLDQFLPTSFKNKLKQIGQIKILLTNYFLRIFLKQIIQI